MSEDDMSDPWAGDASTTDVTNDDVSTSDDELSQLLADRAPRKQLPWVTAVLVAAILLSVGYVAGGYHYTHKGSSSQRLPDRRRSRCTRRRLRRIRQRHGSRCRPREQHRNRGRRRDGDARLGGGATIGTVKLVDGNNVYLTDSSGATVKVTLAKGGTVTVSKKGTLADLTPGTAVVVVGQTGIGRQRQRDDRDGGRRLRCRPVPVGQWLTSPRPGCSSSMTSRTSPTS